MNKIYKVIWNEARNAYVVVSEIAKNHGSKSCSTKKLLAMLIATGVMTCASVAPAMAANLAPTETKIEIGEDASASGEGSVAIGQKAVASNLVAIAIGRDAVASGVDSIAIGSDTKATQTYSVAVGNDIGFTAYAGTAVGQQAYASGKNATAIGTMTNVNDDNKWTEANPGQWRNAGEQSTAIGAYAGSWGVASTAVGGFSKAEGKLATAIGYNSQANVDYGTALGDYSEVKAGWGVAIGASSFADRESHVVGLYAPDEDKDSLTWKANAGAVSVGSSVEGQEITRQITNVAAGSADTDAVNVAQLNAVKAAAGKKVSLVDGENTKATLVKDDATGTQYKVDVDLSKYAKTEDVAVVYDKNKTSLRSTNAGVEDNSIALGKDTYAAKDSVAIGNGASVVVGSNGVSGVALGNKAHAGYKGTSLGSNAISGREGTTLVGANTNSGSLYTTVVGTDSVINSDGTTYKVSFMGIKKELNVQGATATVVGSKNTVDNKNGKVYSGVANNVMGSANTVEGSNGVTIQGTGNKVTDAYKDMNIGAFEAYNIGKGDYSALAKKKSGAVAVIGGANTVSKQTDSTVIGYDNKLTGDNEKGSHDVFMAGSHNELTNVSDSIVMGNKNVITGVSNVISFGHQNEITANNAVAIGSGAGVSAEGGVALGVGSVADRAAEVVGYDPATGAEYVIPEDDAASYVWKATKGAVSVGSARETRQITNVAAGTEDTDAVNVAQLKKVSEAAANANKGWKLKTTGGTESVVAPGATVEFDGDDNIQVGNVGNKVSVTLKKQLTGIQSITGAGEGAGSISFANDGIKFNNKVTIDNTGKITGVAAGVADTDAVNVGQLNAVVQAGNTDTHIKAGEYGVGADNKVNMDVVDKNGNKVDTVTIKDVAKASDVGNVNNIASDIKNKEGKTTVVDAVNNLNDKVGNLQYSKVEKGEIADGDSTTTAIGKLDQKLTDVAATAAKHTKVEGSSNITVNNTAKEGEAANYKVELNKDIDVDTVTANSVTTGQTVMNNDGLKVGENVSVTGTAVTAGQASISNEGLAVGPNTSLKADELKVDGKNYIDKDGLNANGQHITNVKAGEADTDAVNYGQLKDTNNHIDRVENQVVNNTNRISNLDNRVNKVGAGAAALAALHPLDFDPDAKWDFAAGYGNYRGANAAAVGAYYRPNEDTMFSVGGTFGNGENMVNAGVSFKLGSGSSHVSTSRVAMAKEIKELRGELEAMKSAMLDANAGKKIDTSKLQLFPDVPQNHWAYEYVAQLAGNGMIEGYPDGNFAGDRPMTRYEFAAILYRAMTKGAVLSDKILSEFSHELEYFTVDTIAKDKAGNPTIQRVRTVKENKNK